MLAYLQSEQIRTDEEALAAEMWLVVVKIGRHLGDNVMPVKLIDLQLIYGVAGARDKFEDLAAHLVKAHEPRADKVRIHQGDGGIDVYVGEVSDPSGIEVYQCKFFAQGLKDSQKAQIRNSFKQCHENTNFKLKKWTLCLPIDLSMEEKIWFENWKNEQSSLGITIENPWGATRLEGLLYEEKNRDLREAFFGEEHLAQIRESHSMLQQLVPEMYKRLKQDQIPQPKGGQGGNALAENGGKAEGGRGGDAGSHGDGGFGGNAIATGLNSEAYAGPGGRGGINSGSPGGDAILHQPPPYALYARIWGGEGGESAQPDGRGGRGGRSPIEIFGLDISYRLPDGRCPGEGGRGANTPEFDGKVTTINRLYREYLNLNSLEPNSSKGNDSTTTIDWLNQRLQQMNTIWRVRITNGEYEFIHDQEFN